MKTFKVFCIFLLNCFLQLSTVQTVEGIQISIVAEDPEYLYDAMYFEVTRYTDGYGQNFTQNLTEKLITYMEKEKKDINRYFARLIHSKIQNFTEAYFNIFLRAQLQVYDSYGQRNNNENKLYLVSYASNLYELKNHKLYDKMDSKLKEKVKTIINELPESVKYFFFEPSFCLLNRKYSIFINDAMKPDQTIDNTSYNIRAEIQNFSGTKFDVSLRGSNMYYFIMADTEKHEVLLWDSSSTPKGHIWTMEFSDIDRVVFSQSGYLMCTVKEADKARRNVAGRQIGDTFTTTSPECQWRLGKCTL